MTAGDFRTEDDFAYAWRVEHSGGGRRTMTSQVVSSP